MMAEVTKASPAKWSIVTFLEPIGRSWFMQIKEVKITYKIHQPPLYLLGLYFHTRRGSELPPKTFFLHSKHPNHIRLHHCWHLPFESFSAPLNLIPTCPIIMSMRPATTVIGTER
jgi:hypothetical protein